MGYLLEKAAAYYPPGNIWVNPDCGLKTRRWTETIAALKNMVQAANRRGPAYRRRKWFKIRQSAVVNRQCLIADSRLPIHDKIRMLGVECRVFKLKIDNMWVL